MVYVQNEELLNLNQKGGSDSLRPRVATSPTQMDNTWVEIDSVWSARQSSEFIHSIDKYLQHILLVVSHSHPFSAGKNGLTPEAKSHHLSTSNPFPQGSPMLTRVGQKWVDRVVTLEN